jgi:hypothetical protein
MFYYMRQIDTELRSRGLESRKKLVSLLQNKDRFVRYYAAQHTLALAPQHAREAIEWNAKYWFDAIAGDARGFLRSYDNGEFTPD